LNLATSDSTGAINIWNTTTGRSVGGLAAKARYHPTGEGLFSPDSRWLLTRRTLDSPLLWNLDGSEPTLTLAVPSQKNSSIHAAFSSDGQQAACASADDKPTNQIWVFDLSTGRRVFAAQTTNLINGLRFSADNRRLLTEEHDLVAVYDMGTGKNVNRIYADFITISSEDRRILGIDKRPGGTSNKTETVLRTWDGDTGVLLAEHTGDYRIVTGSGGLFVIRSNEVAIVDPVTLMPAALIPQPTQEPLWFFARARRTVVVSSLGVNPSLAPTLSLYDAAA
jgi:WD40 repeat protein